MYECCKVVECANDFVKGVDKFVEGDRRSIEGDKKFVEVANISVESQ
jgi:hypothetical protein